jgi:serine/threonine-protein kinase HipA
VARRLRVFLEETYVGSFAQDESGQESFQYDPAWLGSEHARPLSLSLPLRVEPFEDRQTRAFFGGLLPDDELRRRLGQYLGVSPQNEFALLAEVGRECAGAISILPEGEGDPLATSGSLRVLDDNELLAVLEELPRRPLYVGDELRLSLAGAQDKIAVQLVEDQVALPLGGRPSTHILKTPIADYQETVQNEFFCMRLASRLGLSVPHVFLRQVGETPLLLVERYDRTVQADGQVRRVHQEDACQALGIPPSLKYQSEGGPSLERLFGLLAVHALRPAVDRLSLLRWAVFNYLIGNADAHGKNVSFLHGGRGIELAPFYDLMCTLVYPRLSVKMAMRIGSKYRFDQVRRQHWEDMARAAGLAPAQVAREVSEMGQKIGTEARTCWENETELSGSPLIGQIVAKIEQRAAGAR